MQSRRNVPGQSVPAAVFAAETRPSTVAGVVVCIDATLAPVTNLSDCGPQKPTSSLQATADTLHSSHLRWDAPQGIQLPDHYDVAIADGPRGFSFSVPGDVTEATMGGLQPGRDYTFLVTAHYGNGGRATAASNLTHVPPVP